MKTASIYKDVVYSGNKPVITVLLETNFTKEIRIVLQQGTVMKEHKTKFPIVVQLIEGNLNFGVEGNTHLLAKGDLIALEGNVPHNLKAIEDCIVRLTLTKYDNTERVKQAIDN